MKNAILLSSFFAISFFGFSQKEGSYMPNSPIDKRWESVDGKDGEAPMAGMTQQFFFLLSDGAPD